MKNINNNFPVIKNFNLQKRNYGKIILRIGLAIVFLYFSISQFQNPTKWVSLLPDFLQSFGNPIIFIYVNALFDALVGIFFISGRFLKVFSLLAFLHLLGITLFSLGFSPQGFRDLGLAFASLSLFFEDEN
jgi:uncharacterized membrane protein YphA (DoxX/SURF4 family)